MKKRSFFLLLVAPFLVAGKCSGDNSNPLEPEEDEFTTVVDLVNANDPEAIHFFAPGEDFPCCRLTGGDPGGVRNKSMTVKTGQSYTFRAGRNGEIVGQVVCRVSIDATSSDHFSVFWYGDRPMACGAVGWS